MPFPVLYVDSVVACDDPVVVDAAGYADVRVAVDLL